MVGHNAVALMRRAGAGVAERVPAEQCLYRPLRSTEDAERIWHASEELTKVPFPTSGQGRPHSVKNIVA